jgi:hypothetical protein
MGDAVNCDLVKLHVWLFNPDSSEGEGQRPSISIKCAVSDTANDDLLLPIDVIDRLRLLNTSESHVCSDNDNDSNIEDETTDEHCDNVTRGECNLIDGTPGVNVVTRSGCDTNSDATNHNRPDDVNVDEGQNESINADDVVDLKMCPRVSE